MAKVRVAVWGTVGRSVFVETDLGPRVTALETAVAALGTPGSNIRHRNLLGLQQGDDHPQYTMWQGNETIKAPWNFDVIPFIQGDTLAEYIEDVVGGGGSHGGLIQDSPSITWVYNDTAATLEGNIVDEYIEDLVGSMLVNTTYIDLDYGDSDGSIKAILDAGAVRDLVGTGFQDSSSIDFSYDSGTKRYAGAVITANPSGLIGMSAVNGTAATPLRSDATHAIDPAIAPTWTRIHTFTPSSGRAFNAIGVDNTYIAGFTGGSTVGQSYGFFIQAGTNSSDSALDIINRPNTLGLFQIRGDGVVNFQSGQPVRLLADNQELQLGASQDLRLYHDGTNSIVRTDTGGLRLQFSTNNRVEVNTTGMGFNGATPIARPDYTITNPTTNRSIDVSAITHAQLAQVVGTMIQDFINYGLYQ